MAASQCGSLVVAQRTASPCTAGGRRGRRLRQHGASRLGAGASAVFDKATPAATCLLAAFSPSSQAVSLRTTLPGPIGCHPCGTSADTMLPQAEPPSTAQGPVKWARESLLLDGEAAKYDANLRDRYERKYDAEIDGVDTANEFAEAQFGRQMCNWASQQEVQFRNVIETWITAGSFHGLADRLEIGWHPQYLTLLSAEKATEDA